MRTFSSIFRLHSVVHGVVFMVLHLRLASFAKAEASQVYSHSQFPESQSPYVSDASIPLFGQKCGEAVVIRNAALSQYTQIATANYVPPQCSGWVQAIVRLDGAVKGVQFDRFGAVWLSGVPVLRTTTPEPNPDGITWQVLRDITSVSPLLNVPGNMSLQIPNVVDSTYTGVLKVNVSIDFYKPTDKALGSVAPKLVRPLTHWSSLFDTAVSGKQPQSNLISNLPRNMISARLEVFASGHGSEEFWYTLNGAYREIEVYVDGIVAGIAYPFPVIYTGGVNPLLWRPQTGIGSFSVPPYSFDLSPFLGMLNDGKEHNISLNVRNNQKTGVWYLDGVLHAELHSSADVLSGELMEHTDERPEVVVNSTSLVSISEGHRKVHVTGSITLPDQQKLIYEVRHVHSAFNNNTNPDSSLSITTGWMLGTSTFSQYRTVSDVSLVMDHRFTTESRFPYFLSDYSVQGDDTFQIGPTVVNYSRSVRSTIAMDNNDYYHPLKNFSLGVSSSTNATALYNRSITNRSLVYKAFGTSEAESTLHAGADVGIDCAHDRLTAVQGYATSSSRSADTCDWHSLPLGIYACGLSFCAHPDGTSRSPTHFLKASLLAEEPMHRSTQPAVLPFRHRMISSEAKDALYFV